MSEFPTAPQKPVAISKQLLSRLFFFGVFLLLLYQLLRLLAPFFTSLMSAITLTLIFYPIYARLTRLIESRNIAALLSTLLALVTIIVPLLFAVWLLVKEAAEVFPAAKAWMGTQAGMEDGPLGSKLPPFLAGAWTEIHEFLAIWQLDLEEIALNNIRQLGNEITGFGARMVRNVVLTVFDVVALIMALFFFFRDGTRIVWWTVELIPLERENKEQIVQGLGRTLSAVVRGIFITALVQGLLAGAGFAFVGIGFPVLLGFTTAFMALIPFLGATSVWLPVTIFLLLKGTIGTAIVLALWGALVVSLVDNVLRPVLIGEVTKLPTLLLFLGILGGLQAYGFIGLLVGPLLIASVFAFIKIYQQHYHVARPT
ncbi:MAG: AI-2E family transporter [Gammaproteobacteria bacterium]